MAADIKAKWGTFKMKFGKAYRNASEEAVRLRNFAAKLDEIAAHNERFARGEVSFELGVNDFSDLSDDEFRDRFLMKNLSAMLPRSQNIISSPVQPTDGGPIRNTPLARRNGSDELPGDVNWSVDWRQLDVITPIKNQGGCGSCYAFAALASVESAYAMRALNRGQKQIVDLSEQQVVDCSVNFKRGMNAGCRGGTGDVTFDWIASKGLVTEDRYGYSSGGNGQTGSCRIPGGGSYGRGLTYSMVAKDEMVMESVVGHQSPLFLPIDASCRSFSGYRSGILDDPSCTKVINHVVQLVGYGREGGKDYWSIKNSWGTGWGEQGFARIRRKTNQCGILTDYTTMVQLA